MSADVLSLRIALAQKCMIITAGIDLRALSGEPDMDGTLGNVALIKQAA
jgi:hypothetical protein